MKRAPYFSDLWFQNKAVDNISYQLTPDDITLWNGLIDPTGHFYSVESGCHKLKAYYLISKQPQRFGRNIGSSPDIHGVVLPEEALDVLLANGWCATHRIGTSNYLSEPKLPKQLTKAQIDTIQQACIKHGIYLPIRDVLPDT